MALPKTHMEAEHEPFQGDLRGIPPLGVDLGGARASAAHRQAEGEVRRSTAAGAHRLALRTHGTSSGALGAFGDLATEGVDGRWVETRTHQLGMVSWRVKWKVGGCEPWSHRLCRLASPCQDDASPRTGELNAANSMC